MRDARDLRRILRRIDGRGYRAYKDIRGSYSLPGAELHVDHVQGDPFASPSLVRVRAPQTEARLPEELTRVRVRRTALEDFLARRVREAVREVVRGTRGTGKSGMISVDAGGQEVLERTAVRIGPGWVEARLHAGLPAAGRRVLGGEAERMLLSELPTVLKKGLLWENLPQTEGVLFVECVENQEHIRSLLDDRNLLAFIADGSILPRESGVSDRPLAKRAVAFRSPESLRVEMPLLNPVPGPGGPKRTVRGLGVPKGVTLIVGGGYHGKSTLLRALERGVYPHVPGDGREYVVARRDLAKIRAEDGRGVERVDITSFITHLPGGRSTSAFSSPEASGSTSQAANIVEALEAGAGGFLLDEDTSATNFMIRDARMQALVHKDQEPITPFVDRVRELFESLGISTVLVMGGCGDYFEAADAVVRMREYLPEDATAEAKRVASERPGLRKAETASELRRPAGRVPDPKSFDPSRGRRDVKIDAKGRDLILFGREPVDLRRVEQLVDASQTRAVGWAMRLASEKFMREGAPMSDVLDALETWLGERGLDALAPRRREGAHPGDLARPRRLEIAAAINRLRTLRVR